VMDGSGKKGIAAAYNSRGSAGVGIGLMSVVGLRQFFRRRDNHRVLLASITSQLAGWLGGPWWGWIPGGGVGGARSSLLVIGYLL
jgi:hypothetical protein